jgi:hypothetical protein
MRHADLLSTEDFPSRNIACGEPWWRPRHRAPGPAQTPYGTVPESAVLSTRVPL